VPVLQSGEAEEGGCAEAPKAPVSALRCRAGVDRSVTTGKDYSVVREFSHPAGKWQTIAHGVTLSAATLVAEKAAKFAEEGDGYVFTVAIVDSTGGACWRWEFGRGVVYPVIGMRAESDAAHRNDV